MKTLITYPIAEDQPPFHAEMLEALIEGASYTCPFTDIECGPAEIAKATQRYITALETYIDKHEPFIDVLRNLRRTLDRV